MNDKEIKMIIELAKRLKEEKKSDSKIMESFISAGILNEKGDLTKPYYTLNSIVTQ